MAVRYKPTGNEHLRARARARQVSAADVVLKAYIGVVKKTQVRGKPRVWRAYAAAFWAANTAVKAASEHGRCVSVCVRVRRWTGVCESRAAAPNNAPQVGALVGAHTRSPVMSGLRAVAVWRAHARAVFSHHHGRVPQEPFRLVC